MEERHYLLALSTLEKISRSNLYRLINFFGSGKKVWLSSLNDWKKCLKIDEEKSEEIYEKRGNLDIEKYERDLKQNDISYLTYLDESYPSWLKEIYDPPLVIYLKGKKLENTHPAVAIVGTRRASAYGKMIASELAEGLARNGITVVSGVARGIDGAAHSGALKAGGLTIGVVGCGLDIVYPPSHKKLYQQIIENGTLVTEYPLRSFPLGWHFPERNRIISGLSLGVVVVEAPHKSGALITADFAIEQGREVFAVPGNVKNNLNKGAHRLIKQGACLVESFKDILNELNLPIRIDKKEEKMALSNDEKVVLKHLQIPLNLDELVLASGYDVARLGSILTKLEIKGYVKQESGKRFIRCDA